MTLAHLHLVLNHVPVLFVPLAGLLLLTGIWLSNSTIRNVAYGILIFGALVSIPVFLTGEPAEDKVENIPTVLEAAIENHEEAAEKAYIVTLVTGASAVLAFVLYRKQSIKELQVAKLVFLMSLVGSGLLFYAANLGGQVRHTEIRAENNSNAAVQINSQENRKDDDGDED